MGTNLAESNQVQGKMEDPRVNGQAKSSDPANKSKKESSLQQEASNLVKSGAKTQEKESKL